MYNFDKSAVYTREIIALAKPLLEACKEQNIPMLIAVGYAHDEAGDSIGTMGVTASDGFYPPALQACRLIIQGNIKVCEAL
jgi:hypothetical protein